MANKPADATKTKPEDTKTPSSVAKIFEHLKVDKKDLNKTEKPEPHEINDKQSTDNNTENQETDAQKPSSIAEAIKHHFKS